MPISNFVLLTSRVDWNKKSTLLQMLISLCIENVKLDPHVAKLAA